MDIQRDTHTHTRVRELDIPDCPPRDGGGEVIRTRPGLPRGSGRGEICRGEVGEDSARQGVHSVSSVVSVWIIMSVRMYMHVHVLCNLHVESYWRTLDFKSVLIKFIPLHFYHTVCRDI